MIMQEGGYIATQLASFIANLGYPATANHLRHYESGAVTTELPLIPDNPVDIGVEDFRRICKRCAVCCPSNSIPLDGDQTVVNGTLRWERNAETSFEYWGSIGTDCTVCMRVRQRRSRQTEKS